MTHNTWHVTHDKHSFALHPLAWHWPPSYQWWEAVDTLRFLQIEIVIEILFTRRSVTPTASHLSPHTSHLTPHTSHYWMILNVDYCSVLYWQGQLLEPNVTTITSNLNIYNIHLHPITWPLSTCTLTFQYLLKVFLEHIYPYSTKYLKRIIFLMKVVENTYQRLINWKSSEKVSHFRVYFSSICFQMKLLSCV